MATALQLLSNLSSPVSILKGGTALQTRPRVNFIEGSNVTIAVTDDSANYKTDITISATGGGGSGTGTVTSVDLSGGTTGITFSGGPITSSGTITMAGTLEVANGGTGRSTFTSGYVKANGATAFTSVSSIPSTDISGAIPTTIGGLPSGGGKYARLAKNSTTNYDTGWYGPDSFNVRDHGAVGNGSTDDTTAFNAAIAALNSAGRGQLYIPSGVYRITGTLTTITVPAFILGQGIDVTKVACEGVNGFKADYSSGSGHLNFTVKDLSLQISSNSNNVALYYKGVNNSSALEDTFHFSHLQISGGWTYGIQIDNTAFNNTQSASINSCKIIGNPSSITQTSRGISIKNATGVFMDQITVFWANYGIYIDSGCEGNVVNSSTLVSVNYGVYAVGTTSANIWVSDTHIACNTYGVYLGGSTTINENFVQGCYFLNTSSATAAVKINGEGNNVKSCLILSTGTRWGNGVEITGNGNAVSESIIKNITGAAVTIISGSYNRVFGISFNDVLGAAAIANAGSNNQIHSCFGLGSNIDNSWNVNPYSSYGPYIINVRDYGAKGDGSTNDTTAINNAIAALTNNSCLYFPPGQYNVTGLNNLSNLTNVALIGEAATIYQTTQANNILVVDYTCSKIMVDNIRFGGAASSRLNGIHLRFRASDSIVSDCEFYGSSDFGLFIGDHNQTTPTRNVQVRNCYFHDTEGDGLHINNAEYVIVSDCVCKDTGDDSFAAVGYESRSSKPRFLQFLNCQVYNAGARGFAILLCDDVLLSGCQVFTSQLAGVEVGDDGNHSGVFNERIVIRNCSMTDCIQTTGPYAAFNLLFVNGVQIQTVTVKNPATGSCVGVYDFTDAQMRDCSIQVTRTGFCRGLIAIDAATLNSRTPRTAWGNLFMNGYSFDLQQSDNNEAIYVDPATGITIENLVITDAVGSQVPTGNYIFYNQINTAAKIGNNVCLQTRTISGGGSGVTATTFNNN